MSGTNKHGVKVGQVWVDNDNRITKNRRFVVVEVEADYYPHGRARCKLIGKLKPGQREAFYARLDRFNSVQRGYSLVAESEAEAEKVKAPKVTKKKAKKKAAKK